MRLLSWTICVVAMVLCSYVRADSPATEPSALPRYHLSPGQELTYASTGTFKYETGTLKSGSTNIYDVVARNPDGGWHIIGRLSSWQTQGDNPAQPDTDLIAFDLRPDGTATMSPGVSAEKGTGGDFPALPADQSQWENSWTSDRPYGGHITYKALSALQPNLAEFTGVAVDPIDRIYLMANQTTYQFDSGRGLLTGATSQNSQGYGFVGNGGDVTTLTNDTDKPRKWLDQFSRDCEAYFAAQAKYSDMLGKTEVDPAQCDSLLATAKDILTAARNQAGTAEIVDLLDQQIAGLDSQAQYIKHEAESRQAVLNKPAPTWELADQLGSKHSLEDYRGKVVVLDFWYRGCGWCMRAMPEMKQLAADFAGKPVAVLGMNTDSDPADPKFVVDAFGLDYPILHVEQNIVQQYHVQGFPSVFIIGPDGMMRDVEVGYSPKLHDKLATKITGLIPGK
jgi:peroxiredoxin